MRHIEDVIDKILTVLPEAETELKEELTALRKRSLFIAPEEPWIWKTLENILVRGIGVELDEEWKRQVSRIVRNEE